MWSGRIPAARNWKCQQVQFLNRKIAANRWHRNSHVFGILWEIQLHPGSVCRSVPFNCDVLRSNLCENMYLKMMWANGETFMKMLRAMVFWGRLRNDEPISDFQRCIRGEYIHEMRIFGPLPHFEKSKIFVRHHEFRFLDFTAAITRTGITCLCPKPKYYPMKYSKWHSLALKYTIFHADCLADWCFPRCHFNWPSGSVSSYRSLRFWWRWLQSEWCRRNHASLIMQRSRYIFGRNLFIVIFIEHSGGSFIFSSTWIFRKVPCKFGQHSFCNLWMSCKQSIRFSFLFLINLLSMIRNRHNPELIVFGCTIVIGLLIGNAYGGGLASILTLPQ